jgi:hypothetical protein
MIKSLAALITLLSFQFAFADAMEIYCTIRSGKESLNCQIVGKDSKVMSSEDISNFIDQGLVAAYITLKSRKNMERTFFIDANAPQYKKLNELKRSASISEINRAKSELFAEMERRIIKTSDELDVQAANAELVLYDSSIASDKFKRENGKNLAELDNYRKNKDKICTTTPGFEAMSRANASLQSSLSNILYAFQTPGTCMSDFKVFKDRDGSVDLRQLDQVTDKYKSLCKKQ